MFLIIVVTFKSTLLLNLPFFMFLDVRFMELTLKPGQELLPGTQYFVTVKEGLAPLTGLALRQDYTFNFYTSGAGSSAGPYIEGIEPSFGGIEGNTPVVVYGMNFEIMPETAWVHGYKMFWIVSAIITLTLTIVLRKARLL